MTRARNAGVDETLRALERATRGAPHDEDARLRYLVALARTGRLARADYSPEANELLASAVLAESEDGHAQLLEHAVREILDRANEHVDPDLELSMDKLVEQAVEGARYAPSQETMWMVPGAMSHNGQIRSAYAHGGPFAGAERLFQRETTYALVVIVIRGLPTFPYVIPPFPYVFSHRGEDLRYTIGAREGFYATLEHGEWRLPSPDQAWWGLAVPEWAFLLEQRAGELGKWQDPAWALRSAGPAGTQRFYEERGPLELWNDRNAKGRPLAYDRVRAPHDVVGRWLALRELLFEPLP